ncbi:hypothetical protein HOY80DRAFT_969059 [Tuber brumale]|nr:hypothetical protein HOY80DRAFT_969059 [Tuber brumale]
MICMICGVSAMTPHFSAIFLPLFILILLQVASSVGTMGGIWQKRVWDTVQGSVFYPTFSRVTASSCIRPSHGVLQSARH